MEIKLICVALFSTTLLVSNMAWSKERVDMALCLAADTSSSIGDNELFAQRFGHATALNDSQVLNAIQSNSIGKIAVAYVEWADTNEQRLTIDWMTISDSSTALEFAKRMDTVLQTPSPFQNARRATSISHAIGFCLALFEKMPYKATRHVIDISSDGTNNSSDGTLGVNRARDRALLQDVSINVLAILTTSELEKVNKHVNPDEGLENYFKQNVIVGIGAFVEVANDRGAFEKALTRKLRKEIIASR